jgi:hypothetical protein
MVIFVGLALLALVVLAGGLGEWLLFGLVLWGFFAILRPGQRHRRHGQRRKMRGGGLWEQLAWEQQPSSWVAARAGRLPVDVQLKAEQISRKAESLMQFADRFPTGSQDLYILQRTIDEYLPNTLDAYLALPPGYGHAAVSADGKTALQALWEQLNLLDGKLDEIAQHVHRHNLDRLVANGRFLEERFGRSDSELDRAVPLNR